MVLTCTWDWPDVWWQTICDYASEDVLAQFFNFVAHYGLKGVSRHECPPGRFWGMEQESFGGDCLHLYPNADGVNGERSLVIDAEATRESLAELDGTE